MPKTNVFLKFFPWRAYFDTKLSSFFSASGVGILSQQGVSSKHHIQCQLSEFLFCDSCNSPRYILKKYWDWNCAFSDCLSWNILYLMVSVVLMEETNKFSQWHIHGQVHLFPQKSSHLWTLHNFIWILTTHITCLRLNASGLNLWVSKKVKREDILMYLILRKSGANVNNIMLLK